MYFGPEHYLNRDAAAGKVMSHARLLLKLSRRFTAIAPVGMRIAARCGLKSNDAGSKPGNAGRS